MALLIDGYNLLHATGIFGKGTGPGGFQRSREALLRFLVASIDEKERNQTIIVFDATQAPPGLPHTVDCEGMIVRYAAGYPDADTLIEEIVEEFNAPRSLLVVSSDHRIQRAARRRKAAYIDSDPWYRELCEKRRQDTIRRRPPPPEKPQGKLSGAEMDYWLQEFDDVVDPSLGGLPAGDNSPKSTAEDRSIENPFPPGYGDDLLEEDFEE